MNKTKVNIKEERKEKLAGCGIRENIQQRNIKMNVIKEKNRVKKCVRKKIRQNF